MIFERGKTAILTDRYPTMDDPVWEMVHGQRDK